MWVLFQWGNKEISWLQNHLLQRSNWPSIDTTDTRQKIWVDSIILLILSMIVQFIKYTFQNLFFWTSWNYQLDSFWLQLMEKTGFDNEIYLWHHAVNKWRLSKGSSFRDRVKRTIVYINSQGRPGTWIQFQLIFKKTMSSSLEALGMNMFMMNGRKLLRWSYHKFFCSVAKANLFVVIQKI